MLSAAEAPAVLSQLMVGGLEVLVLTLVMWTVAAFVIYWVLRKAIAHGIQDAHRDRTVEPAASDVRPRAGTR